MADVKVKPSAAALMAALLIENSVDSDTADRADDFAAIIDAKFAPLVAALREANNVMNHFGDVLNGMDCVAEVEAQTGVPNKWVNKVFLQVTAALASLESK